jgi:hypothetical protein
VRIVTAVFLGAAAIPGCRGGDSAWCSMPVVGSAVPATVTAERSGETDVAFGAADANGLVVLIGQVGAWPASGRTGCGAA